MPPSRRSPKAAFLAIVACVASLLALPASPAAAAPAAPDPAPAPAACAALADLDLTGLADAPTRIGRAEPAGGTDGIPRHCRVTGTVAPEVNFELLLPEPAVWNGKFLFGGCGGLCGTLDTYHCQEGLTRGYAAATTDTGHRGTGPFGPGTEILDATWAYQNELAVIDWAHRGVHVATLATKAITTSYYDRDLAQAYFVGCSNGGRQALMEAQRYPHDFDGIVAGDPGLDYRTVTLDWVWAANANLDEHGRPIITEADLGPIHQAVLDQCDGLDGTADGVVDDPGACDFDPSMLACDQPVATGCLDGRQVEALRKLYAVPTNSRGEPVTDGGLLPGSEGDWPAWVTGTGGLPPFNQVLGDGMLHYLAFDEPPGPDYDPRAFDFDHDPARMQGRFDLVSAVDTDLRPFRDAGGKLIMTVGLADGVLRPTASAAYYERVAKRLGGDDATQEFFRAFMIPGKNHCQSTPYGGPADPLELLEDWVERGQAPDRLEVDYEGAGGRPDHRRAFPPHRLG